MATFSAITEKCNVKDVQVPPLDSENSICAALRCHLSTSWVLVNSKSEFLSARLLDVHVKPVGFLFEEGMPWILLRKSIASMFQKRRPY